MLTERKSIDALSLNEAIYHAFIVVRCDWNDFKKTCDEDIPEADIESVCGLVLSYASDVVASTKNNTHNHSHLI